MYNKSGESWWSFSYTNNCLKLLKFKASMLVPYLVPVIFRLVFVFVSLSQNQCILIDLDSLDFGHVSLTIFSAQLVNFINVQNFKKHKKDVIFLPSPVKYTSSSWKLLVWGIVASGICYAHGGRDTIFKICKWSFCLFVWINDGLEIK